MSAAVVEFALFTGTVIAAVPLKSTPFIALAVASAVAVAARPVQDALLPLVF